MSNIPLEVKELLKDYELTPKRTIERALVADGEPDAVFLLRTFTLSVFDKLKTIMGVFHVNGQKLVKLMPIEQVDDAIDVMAPLEKAAMEEVRANALNGSQRWQPRQPVLGYNPHCPATKTSYGSNESHSGRVQGAAVASPEDHRQDFADKLKELQDALS